ncbi:MAG: hypothetical protein GC129_01280 [Proteobacteria bacterium]|nr:hypothetical protein [Pseudomonadota bacterium]
MLKFKQVAAIFLLSGALLFPAQAGPLLDFAAQASGKSPGSLSSIPLRCIAAFEIAESEYKACRYSSLRGEIYSSAYINFAVGCISAPGRDGPTPESEILIDSCKVQRHLEWEIKALKELAASIKKNP